MVGLQRSVPVLRAAPALGWNTPPHYRDTPLNYHYRGGPTLPLLLMRQNTRGPPDIKYLS